MKNKLNIRSLLDDKNIRLTHNEYNYIIELIYKINEFIIKRDSDLNKNLKNNLTSLKIRKDKIEIWENGYNSKENELIIDNSKWDIVSILEMASTNRNKKYSGIVMDDGLGYGLNAGITEYFSKCLSNKRSYYVIESLVAETLLKLNYNVVFYSYFYNNGSNMMQFGKNINDLLIKLDLYHSNYLKMNKMISNTKNKNSIFRLQCSNFYCMYYIIENLIKIIDESFIDENEKYKIVSDFVSKFNSIISFEEFKYLKELKIDVKKNVKVYKRKVE